jgi:hypothetical protein
LDGDIHAASVYPIPEADAKGWAKNSGAGRGQTGQNRPKNANDHEQRARVHPALPSYSVVVPAPEL